jgi:hypothetical protein
MIRSSPSMSILQKKSFFDGKINTTQQHRALTLFPVGRLRYYYSAEGRSQQKKEMKQLSLFHNVYTIVTLIP